MVKRRAITVLEVVVILVVCIFTAGLAVMLLARQPGLIDWMEDTVYTGLLFVVAFICLGNLRSRSPEGGSTYQVKGGLRELL